MLVTNPQLRASLPDLLSHPWMTRGFDGPPDCHLLRRESLRADELDRQVIRGMTGFEFGTEDEIERKLVAILESEAYRRAVRYWENKHVEWDSAGGQGGGIEVEAASTPGKPFPPSTSPPSSPFASPSPQLSNTSVSNINQREPPNPTRGYHPLISMYFLAREKMERDRLCGVGHFASSQLSVNPPQHTPEEAHPPSASKPPIQFTVPASTVTSQKAVSGTDYNMRPSRPPAPKSLQMSHDSPGTRPAGPKLATISERMEDEQAEDTSGAVDAPPEAMLSPAAPSLSAGATLVRKFGSLLVGGGSIHGAGDRPSKRTSIFGSPRSSTDVDHAVIERERERRHAAPTPNEKAEPFSISTPTSSPAAGDDGTSTATNRSDVEVPEEGVSRQAHVNGAGAGFELTDGEDDPNANAADKDFKPLFLKGLFRYVRFANVPPSLQVIIMRLRHF